MRYLYPGREQRAGMSQPAGSALEPRPTRYSGRCGRARPQPLQQSSRRLSLPPPFGCCRGDGGDPIRPPRSPRRKDAPGVAPPPSPRAALGTEGHVLQPQVAAGWGQTTGAEGVAPRRPAPAGEVLRPRTPRRAAASPLLSQTTRGGGRARARGRGRRGR